MLYTTKVIFQSELWDIWSVVMFEITSVILLVRKRGALLVEFHFLWEFFKPSNTSFKIDTFGWQPGDSGPIDNKKESHWSDLYTWFLRDKYLKCLLVIQPSNVNKDLIIWRMRPFRYLTRLCIIAPGKLYLSKRSTFPWYIQIHHIHSATPSTNVVRPSLNVRSMTSRHTQYCFKTLSH